MGATSYGIHELGIKMKPKIVIVVVVANDKILVIRRSKDSTRSGEWETPAGHIDEGESLVKAALREVYEETGLEVLLYPKYQKIPIREGYAVQFLATLPGGTNPEIETNPEEHDKFRWVEPEKLHLVKPSPPDFAKNIKKLLRKTGFLGASQMTKKTLRASLPVRNVRVMPDPNTDLKEAILVGDEVDIFLQGHLDSKKKAPAIKGIVERRNRNVLWIRDPDSPYTQAIPVRWNDQGTWSFVRVIRKGDVINFINGNPLDPDAKTISKAKGIGLILDPPKPHRSESVSRILRGETPDLDFSFGQAPQSISVVAPSSARGYLNQVKEILQDEGLEPDLVDDIGNGRVMILTQDPDLKKGIRETLRKHGTEVEATRTGALLVKPRKRRAYAPPAQPAKPAGYTPQAPTTNTPGTSQNQKIQMVVPAPEDPVKQLEKASGAPVVKKGPGYLVTFNDLEKAQNFLDTNARKAKVGKVAFLMRTALKRGQLKSAASSLITLKKLGVREGTLRRASLATGKQWTVLSNYLQNQGELALSRLAQELARFSPVD